MAVGWLYDALFLEHETGEHPERPERLVAIIEAMEASDVLPLLTPLAAGPASTDDLCAVHSLAYVHRVRDLSAQGACLDLDTPLSLRSYDAARLAAGATIAAVESVLEGTVQSGFAVVRPPGHHATPNGGMGFCLFNNVAVAVRYALRTRGLRRVMIVDHDVHHGNGTQDTFQAEPLVLYCSTHEYPFYPGSGAIEDTGVGSGSGYSINVPLPRGVGDRGFRAVFQEIIEPAARRFRPELIVVSAGYDAHWLDPIGMMAVSVAGFAEMAERLLHLAKTLCGGRLVFALEGGYHLQALASAVVATIETLVGRVASDPIGPPPRSSEPDIGRIIARVKSVHQL